MPSPPDGVYSIGIPTQFYVTVLPIPIMASAMQSPPYQLSSVFQTTKNSQNRLGISSLVSHASKLISAVESIIVA